MKSLLKKIVSFFSVAAIAVSMPLSVSANEISSEETDNIQETYEESQYYIAPGLDLTDEDVDYIIEKVTDEMREIGCSEEDIEDYKTIWMNNSEISMFSTDSNPTRNVKELLVCALTTSDVYIPANSVFTLNYSNNIRLSPAITTDQNNNQRYSYMGYYLNDNGYGNYYYLNCTVPVSNRILTTTLASNFTSCTVPTGYNAVTFNFNYTGNETGTDMYTQAKSNLVLSVKNANGVEIGNNFLKYVCGIGDLYPVGNPDGKITSEDVQQLSKYYILQESVPSDKLFEIADVTRNCIVDIRDITGLKRYLNGLTDTFWNIQG